MNNDIKALMPDEAWLGFFCTPAEGIQIRGWAEKKSEPELETKYLKYKPILEHAEGMREALEGMRLIQHGACSVEVEKLFVSRMNTVLDIIKAKEDDTKEVIWKCFGCNDQCEMHLQGKNAMICPRSCPYGVEDIDAGSWDLIRK